MNLADTKLLEKCTKSYELIYAGQYEEAKEELGDLWFGVTEKPTTKNPDLLFVYGSLSRRLGSSKRLDIQNHAKDLLSESLRLFQSQNRKIKASEAQYELSMCYFCSGAYDEARIVLDEALEGLEDEELRAKVLIRKSIIEIWTGKYHEAWERLKELEPVLKNSSDAIKGRWHGQMALVLRRLASAEYQTEYFDKSIIEYTAAIYHYELAGHERFCATNLNNLAFLLYKLNRYEEAHEYLDRAHKFLARLKDIRLLAQVDETRCRILFAQERYEESKRIIVGVVDSFEKNGEQALLADALIIKATVQNRLGDKEFSLHCFRRAINVAENAGALTNAGQATLSMIEEHWKSLSEYEIYQVYLRADRFLKNTQDVEDILRLRKCARLMGRKLFGKNIHDADFNLPDVVKAYEARFIEQALKEENGIITRAAKHLGITYQSLASMLKARHKKLINKRKRAASRK
jgi:tetratricopeptide (TPR) repeat protein